MDDSANTESFKKAITKKTRGIFVEIIGNPRMNIQDIEAISNIAHENLIPLVVDNIFASFVKSRR